MVKKFDFVFFAVFFIYFRFLFVLKKTCFFGYLHFTCGGRSIIEKTCLHAIFWDDLRTSRVFKKTRKITQKMITKKGPTFFTFFFDDFYLHDWSGVFVVKELVLFCVIIFRITQKGPNLNFTHYFYNLLPVMETNVKNFANIEKGPNLNYYTMKYICYLLW